jgi:hypothetical protein
MQPMLNAEPLSYRWQDHVIAPHHGAASLAATALIVLLVGAAVMFSVVDSTPPTAPAAHPAAHVSTEQTPPLVQLAKRPIRPRAGEAWL